MMGKPLLSKMTLKEKIAQCLCVPQFDLNNRTEVDRNLLRTPEERDQLIADNQYGVIWCHGGQRMQGVDLVELKLEDIKVPSADYKEWVRNVEKNLKIPSLRAIDAERVGAGSVFEDLTYTCEPLNVGATDSEELAFALGAAVAKELKCAGLNWRWAPVVDIANRFAMNVMRGYSQDPDTVIRLANANIRGVQSEGVAATAKHFPGADRYEYRDAHFTQTMLFSDMKEWWREQGKIFQGVIDGGVYSVMTSHIAFPAADDTKIKEKYIPATLSKKIITNLLKEEMGFQGVVVTDGITMAGLSSFYEHDDLVVELMKAGNDVLLSCGIHDADILEKAVLDGRLSEERIDDACQRVLDMKEKLGLFDEGYTLDTYTSEEVTSATRALDIEIARKSITLVRDLKQMLPIEAEKVKNVTVICSTHDETFFTALENMKMEFETRGIHTRLHRRLESLEEMKEIAETSDLIIYAAYLAPHQPKGAMAFFGEECQAFHHAFTYGEEKSIGISMGYPYIHYDIMGNADTFLNAYGSGTECMKAVVEAILGEIPIVGKSPVRLEPTHRIW